MPKKSKKSKRNNKKTKKTTTKTSRSKLKIPTWKKEFDSEISKINNLSYLGLKDYILEHAKFLDKKRVKNTKTRSKNRAKKSTVKILYSNMEAINTLLETERDNAAQEFKE